MNAPDGSGGGSPSAWWRWPSSVRMWLTLSVLLAPPPPAKVAVPDLTGMTLEEATATLQDKHLALGTVVQVEVDDADPGTVANQRPSRLTQVDEGSPVNVEIDAG